MLYHRNSRRCQPFPDQVCRTRYSTESTEHTAETGPQRCHLIAKKLPRSERLGMYDQFLITKTGWVKVGRSAPFSAAHLLASAHSTSLSSSRSDLFPTRTTTRFGLPSARASASHRDRFRNEARLDRTVHPFLLPSEPRAYLVMSYTKIAPAAPR